MQHEYAFSLPHPDAISAAHSERCADYIRARIRDAGGSISFAEFMHYALYAQGLGYYSAGTRKFGNDGDFVTAPEISPLFGRVIARQCAGVLQSVPGGSVLEFGAGSGRLALDVLRTLEELDAVPAEYRILEVSADLRERQQRLLHEELPGLAHRISWLERMPDTHRGVVLANEVLDALPVERFMRRNSGVYQLRVGEEDGEFVFVDEPAPDILANAIESIERDIGGRLPDNYVSEVSLAAPAWLRDVAQMLEHGMILLFDYGVSRREYYAPERSEGWLRCHFRHRVHSDPLILAGIQDLTAWVDFSVIAEAAASSGLDILGYVSQSQFLIAGGIGAELHEFTDMPIESQLQTAAQIKILTLPGEMGENVKCIGLARGNIPRPAAFESADRTHTL
ncbi:MAG: SAM-dependent methyltransferase [Deltaproteobacteria bacterium]|jgi:SAM-dependent MidA family methyltransferase|nr:SAM-dependent methyltransferase [Deltaproteobacteria bacterium]